jgi:C4-dicarboxylate-specific signal transduction histidine kinase
MKKRLDNFFAKKEPIEPIEQDFRIILSDDTVRVIRSKGGLQYDQNKIPICMMGTVYDITERVHLEQQDKQKLNELAHVTRLGLMGQMASGIAHEVNQPLCAIAAYTQVSINFIKTENPNLVKLTEVLFKTQEQALRAGQIIHRMKEFGKSQTQKHVTADINTLIYNATDFCIAELKHNHIKPVFDLSNDLLPVFVDHIQIEQVIINLIKNSIDALQDLPPNIQRQLTIHSFLASNNAIQVSVKDNGLGIDENEKQKILTPFHTTKKDGTGMGLSISRSLIEAYGGTLYFNSEPGKGSTFYFTLPIKTVERG